MIHAGEKVKIVRAGSRWFNYIGSVYCVAVGGRDISYIVKFESGDLCVFGLHEVVKAP